MRGIRGLREVHRRRGHFPLSLRRGQTPSGRRGRCGACSSTGNHPEDWSAGRPLTGGVLLQEPSCRQGGVRESP